MGKPFTKSPAWVPGIQLERASFHLQCG